MASADDQLRRLIGQLFIVGFHSQTADENIKKLIRAPYFVGQIVLFQRNVSDADQLRRLTAELQQVAQDAGHEHPLTIGIDQENGLVTRIQPPITAQLPGSMALGATAAVDDAYNVGRATGRALRAFGINMNYAPVCDVNNNPSNPVIGVRSFSDDPSAVARLAAANLNGLRDEGVIPCVKHFPGHGDTAVDSHYGLPVIQRSWADMEQCELVPFRRAVAEQVPAVMTAHIVIGDSKLPATLDAAVLRSLRDDLKFAGVIVSDCLEMNAIRTECGGTVKGAVTALQSGCDSVMICHTIDLQTGALEAVFDQAKKDSAFRQQLQESHGRRTMALELASKVPNLVVVATCDPYDFLEDDVIKTYLTIYEPTSSAFKAAADVLFGATAAQGTLPVQQAQPATAVEPFTPERDMDQVCSLWHEVLPGYQVPRPHLSGLLKRPQGNHFVIRDQSSVIGFIATHIQPPPPSKPSEHPKGLITAVLVHPHHQSKGVGTALLHHARTLLLSHNCHTLAIGSTFPRFFPGLPTDIAASHQTFFHHRGFSPALGSATARGDTARDLHIDLAADVPNAGATARLAAARSRGLSFRPWTREGEAECLALQRANFGAYAGWVEGYEALARAGLHGQVMVALDEGGAQVAWTMMLEPGTPVFLLDLAFPPLLGGSTGLVAGNCLERYGELWVMAVREVA
ncbi:putative gnat family protein [Neofusicoccum parvum UCRNP2]|uniref:Putative gnat family protein n=1 Tax=Botryosphaeria parva (strain UCR-NP2) TaxID=1287680 RepID=R1EZ11_BOTPV|nr:putative gnat family protein [Neofusicoccum parvum UCRNP2]